MKPFHITFRQANVNLTQIYSPPFTLLLGKCISHNIFILFFVNRARRIYHILCAFIGKRLHQNFKLEFAQTCDTAYHIFWSLKVQCAPIFNITFIFFFFFNYNKISIPFIYLFSYNFISRLIMVQFHATTRAWGIT